MVVGGFEEVEVARVFVVKNILKNEATVKTANNKNKPLNKI